MNSSLVHLAWAVVAVIAFAAGFLVATDRQESSRRSSFSSVAVETGAANSNHPSNDPVRTADRTDQRVAFSLNREQAKVRAFEILEETNRVERMRKLCDFLPAVNSNNWRDVLEAFDVQLRAEGRLEVENWDVILERIGGVAGAAALQESLNTAGTVDRHRVSWLLKGWLVEDLDAASRWFNEQPAATQQWLVGPFATGLSRSDPRRAIEIATQQPQSIWQVSMPYIMANAIQRGGLRGADGLKPFSAHRFSLFGAKLYFCWRG